LKAWDEKYRDMGFVLVGVHSPEFNFEKKYENVLKAVNQYELEYPIAQDNLFITWNLYKNRFWPRKYLVDVDGYIVYDHIGEGAYEETEKVIQDLLKERMGRLDQQNDVNLQIEKPKEAVDFEAGKIRTPEIYFGYQLSQGNFGNPEGIQEEQIVDYTIPSSTIANNVYLSGKWKNNADNFELVSNEGEILLKFQAKVLNIVGGSESNSQAYVLLDDNLLNKENKGSDVIATETVSISSINEFKLYNLVSAEDYGTYTIKIDVTGKGFKIYTFTFG